MVIDQNLGDVEACYTFTFGKVPSKKNSKQILPNRRTGRSFISSSQRHKEWHSAELYRIKSEDLPLVRPPYAVVAQYWAGDLRDFDLSNAQETLHDLFVDAGIIIDDNSFLLQDFQCSFEGFCKGHPRVEVSLLKMKSTAFDDAIALLKAPKGTLKAYAKDKGITQEKLKQDLWITLERGRHIA